MKPIIKVENLSKQYRIGVGQASYGSLREALTGMARAPLKMFRRGVSGGGMTEAETLWALKDVSFSVEPGEVVGIIGRNGAGKSTLLKILSRITEPTTGTIELYGRIGSLLEVGTGFHPELTGRENIFLNGAILGMKRAEISRQFDRIVDFSEIERFIDTPVKHYSSGMYTRLAFAVAAHLEPEILIVDEVLAVGDASFQKKCLGKMGSVAREGRTVLFVSHNLTAMQSLCNRMLWLNQGELVADGTSRQVVGNYLKTSFSTQTEQIWDDIGTAPGNETVRLRSARVRPVDGSHTDSITVRTPFVFEFEFWNLVPETVLNLSLVLVNEEATVLFNTGPMTRQEADSHADATDWHGRPFPAGLFRSVCYVPGNLLNDGAVNVQLHVIKDQSIGIFFLDSVLSFDVREDASMRKDWYGKMIGAVRPVLEWKTELVEERATQQVGS
ncbi:MAG TPA: polysaccharide ABC transporter ATP-binding protein [Pyrinomonadaceae bacterium]|jgi:lipopolysaccharide transport system ATP-binding protein